MKVTHLLTTYGSGEIIYTINSAHLSSDYEDVCGFNLQNLTGLITSSGVMSVPMGRIFCGVADSQAFRDGGRNDGDNLRFSALCDDHDR